MAAAHAPCLACPSAEDGAIAPLLPLYTAHGNGRSLLCEETEDELLELRASNVQLQEEMSHLKAEVGVPPTWQNVQTPCASHNGASCSFHYLQLNHRTL